MYEQRTRRTVYSEQGDLLGYLELDEEHDGVLVLDANCNEVASVRSVESGRGYLINNFYNKRYFERPSPRRR